MAKIVAVCISKRKRTKKQNINQGIVRTNYGLLGDAHSSNNTKRQISLLAIESINKLRKLGLKVQPGDFAENLTTKGINLLDLKIGDRLQIGEEVCLEVTQIGKECKTPCAIYHKVGKCIMPQEGVFAVVLQGGRVKVGDRIKVINGK
jgi:MOSC domain-containing protein YiiM